MRLSSPSDDPVALQYRSLISRFLAPPRSLRCSFGFASPVDDCGCSAAVGGGYDGCCGWRWRNDGGGYGGVRGCICALEEAEPLAEGSG